MKNQLYLQREVVAVEAYSTPDVGQLLKNVFPAITAGFANFTGLFDSAAEVPQLSADQRAVLKELPKHTYLDLSVLTAYKPAGLRAVYLTYIDALEIAVNHVSETFERLAPEYTLLLSRLLNQNDYQMQTQNIEMKFRGVEKQRTETMKDIGNCFNKGATDVTTTVGDVVSRNTDWKMVFDRLEAMNMKISKINRTELNKTIKGIIELLDALKEKIGRGELDKISPEVIRGISEGAYQLAAEVEMYSAIHYRMLELNGTINKTIAHFITSTKA